MTATRSAESTSLFESHLPLSNCISIVRRRFSLHPSNPARSECVEPGTVASYLSEGVLWDGKRPWTRSLTVPISAVKCENHANQQVSSPLCSANLFHERMIKTSVVLRC